ncbi:MAG: universal stress protein [Deltaproteobacteria bacterium]|nr:universal stress protein [Deltaproteobacteria bacterium]
MAKRILLAVDNSKNSLKAVKYVAGTVNKDARVTMLSILPDPTAGCGLDSPALAPIFKENIKAFCTIEQAKKAAVEGFLQEAKKILVKGGFASKNVAVRIRKKKAGIARDILKEAERGKYDTIVIGRRGLTGIKQFLFGSVSNKVVQLAQKASVIVVD